MASAVRLHRFLGKKRALLGFGQGHAVRLFTGSGEIDGMLREKMPTHAGGGTGGLFDEPAASTGSAAIASVAEPALSAGEIKATNKTIVITPMKPKHAIARDWMQKRIAR